VPSSLNRIALSFSRYSVILSILPLEALAFPVSKAPVVPFFNLLKSIKKIKYRSSLSVCAITIFRNGCDISQELI